MKAIELANRNRIAMAETKRAIANGEVSARRIIGDPPAPVRGMKVLDLLKAIRWVGSYKAVMICSKAEVNPLTKIGDLTDRQRMKLLDALHRYPTSEAA